MQPQSLCMFQNTSLEGTRSAIDLEFPEISPAIFKNFTFPLEYVLKYACGLQ